MSDTEVNDELPPLDKCPACHEKIADEDELIECMYCDDTRCEGCIDSHELTCEGEDAEVFDDEDEDDDYEEDDTEETDPVEDIQ